MRLLDRRRHEGALKLCGASTRSRNACRASSDLAEKGRTTRAETFWVAGPGWWLPWPAERWQSDGRREDRWGKEEGVGSEWASARDLRCARRPCYRLDLIEEPANRSDYTLSGVCCSSTFAPPLARFKDCTAAGAKSRAFLKAVTEGGSRSWSPAEAFRGLPPSFGSR